MTDSIWHNAKTSNQCHNTLRTMCKFKKKHLLNEEHNKRDLQQTITNVNINKLNNDCLILIFLYLPIVDRIKIERVCKKWQKISQKCWHNVKELDLTNSTWGFSTDIKLKHINAVILNKVLSRCGKFVNKIHLEKSFCEDRECVLSIIGNLCPNLEIIDISCLQVPSTGITSLVNNCRNIKKLSLDCIYLFDTDLEKLFKVNQKLQYLKLVDNKISGKCLLHLPSDTIEEIIIEKCDYICDDEVVEAVSRLNNLKSLIIRECFDTWEKTTEAVGKYCTKLKTLEIIGKLGMFQFNGISHITSLSDLKYLKVSANWFICNSTLRKLSLHCQQLTYLDLSDIPGHFIRDHTLAAIKKFTKLEILITRDLYQVTSNGSKMGTEGVTYEEELKKNPDLKDEDVQMLRDWYKKQPHLPPVTDAELALFLHSNYYRMESTKTTIDTYFTARTHIPEFFSNRDPLSQKELRKSFQTITVQVLDKKTPEGYSVLYGRLIDEDPSNYVYNDGMKYLSMVVDLWLHKEGTTQGHIILFDMKSVVFGHAARLSPMGLKKYLYYLQEALPVRLKGFHFMNITPVMDVILNMMKPFMKKELLDMLHTHTNLDTLSKFFPVDILPNEAGGKAGVLMQLHEKSVKMLEENRGWFLLEERTKRVNESLRPGKGKSATDLFGVEGTFKKLEID